MLAIRSMSQARTGPLSFMRGEGSMSTETENSDEQGAEAQSAPDLIVAPPPGNHSGQGAGSGGGDLT